jgi:hypothetical protein
MMRKIITALIGGGTAVVATLTLTAAPLSASPGSPNPDTLIDHGWRCDDVVHAVHCIPPALVAKVFSDPPQPPPAFFVLVFDNQTSAFLGTEFNIRADLFHGQPCPTDPTPTGEPGQYTYLPDLGFPAAIFPYYACHRFDSPL